jgi:hypothetical protein
LENPLQIYIERYKSADASALASVIEDLDVPYMIEEMKNVDQKTNEGHLLFLVKKEDQIIGFVWYFVNKYIIEGNKEVTVHLKPNEVCAVNAYITPEYRGLNILNYARECIYSELQKMGVSRVLTFVNSENKSAIRMHKKFGSVSIGFVKYFNILTLCFAYTSPASNRYHFEKGYFIRWKKLFGKFFKFNSTV